jgi:hypothetical protein
VGRWKETFDFAQYVVFQRGELEWRRGVYPKKSSTEKIARKYMKKLKHHSPKPCCKFISLRIKKKRKRAEGERVENEGLLFHYHLVWSLPDPTPRKK